MNTIRFTRSLAQNDYNELKLYLEKWKAILRLKDYCIAFTVMMNGKIKPHCNTIPWLVISFLVTVGIRSLKFLDNNSRPIWAVIVV